MKRMRYALALAVLVFTTMRVSAEPVPRSEFPRIGASYRLTYATVPEGAYFPLEVKILAKGDGQWVLVEYERTDFRRTSIRKVGSQAPQEPTPSPTPSPTPVVTIERKWINFATLLAADEVK